jgi:hypothetical protein
MMKNKKVIFFLESQLIWENGAFGAPVLGWPDPVPKMTPVNILSNEPSLVALSQIITKRPSFENCGIQLTQPKVLTNNPPLVPVGQETWPPAEIKVYLETLF